MNLDLLQKLVKLANNNPNENEANLAARKACKLIEEGEFEFKADKVNLESGNLQDFYKKYYSTGRRAGKSDWFDESKNINWEELLKHFHSTYGSKKQYKPYDYETKGYGPFYEEPKKPKEKRTLTCKHCNTEKETVFVGPVEYFVCNNCQWESFANQGVKDEKEK